MWTAAACLRVLRARAGGVGTFDAAAIGALVAESEGREHLALPHEHGLVRIDVIDGTVRDGPTGLAFDIRYDRDFRQQLFAIRTFDAIMSGWQMPVERNRRLRRAALALRAYDARLAGASLRQIAETLLGPDEWPGPGEYLKSQVRRLVESGGYLMRAGPLKILAS